MLLEETLQRVQSLYSKGVQSKNTRLTQRHIYSATSTARNTLLTQQIDKNQVINQWSYQTLPCVKMIKSSFIECPGLKSSTDPNSVILRSEHKIPKIISGKGKHFIQSVTDSNGEISLYKTTFATRKYASGNKYTANAKRFLLHNDYIYVTIAKELRALTIVALFDSPVDAFLFPDYCNSDSCCRDIMKMEYPLDGDLLDPLVKIASNELVLLMKQMTEDRSSNAEDDTSTSGSMIHDPQQQN